MENKRVGSALDLLEAMRPKEGEPRRPELLRVPGSLAAKWRAKLRQIGIVCAESAQDDEIDHNDGDGIALAGDMTGGLISFTGTVVHDNAGVGLRLEGIPHGAPRMALDSLTVAVNGRAGVELGTAIPTSGAATSKAYRT